MLFNLAMSTNNRKELSQRKDPQKVEIWELNIKLLERLWTLMSSHHIAKLSNNIRSSKLF